MRKTRLPKILILVFFELFFTSCSSEFFKGKVIDLSGKNDFSNELLAKYADFFNSETGEIIISYVNIEYFISDISFAMNVSINNLDSYHFRDANNIPFKHTVVMLDDDKSLKTEEWEDFSFLWEPENPLAQRDGPYMGYVISQGYSYENEVQIFGVLLSIYKTFARIIEEHYTNRKVNIDYYCNKYDFYLNCL